MAKKVFPTKSNLISTKKSLALTQTGWEFLDRKRNILVREMMNSIDRAKSIQTEISQTYFQAFESLKKANIAMGLFGGYSLCVPVDDSVKVDYYSVMGIEIPKVSIGDSELLPFYGMGQTCSELDDAYLKFNKVKKLVVELAEIESGIYRLADAVKKTQKRANALKNIVIPNYEQTIKYISQSLDENERESFARLKVVKNREEKITDRV